MISIPLLDEKYEYFLLFISKERLKEIHELAYNGNDEISMTSLGGIMVKKTIVFTGGGTAGHVTPNIAIINEIKNYDFIYIPSLMNNNGLFNRLKFYVQLLKKPKILIKLLLNK